MSDESWRLITLHSLLFTLYSSLFTHAFVMTSFDNHLSTLFACRLCPNVFGQPVTGAARDARVMLVGQAPGPHEIEDRRPFAYTAGQRLFGWFEKFGVDEAAFRNAIHIC